MSAFDQRTSYCELVFQVAALSLPCSCVGVNFVVLLSCICNMNETSAIIMCSIVKTLKSVETVVFSTKNDVMRTASSAKEFISRIVFTVCILRGVLSCLFMSSPSLALNPLVLLLAKLEDNCGII